MDEHACTVRRRRSGARPAINGAECFLRWNLTGTRLMKIVRLLARVETDAFVLGRVRIHCCCCCRSIGLLAFIFGLEIGSLERYARTTQQPRQVQARAA